MKVPLAIESQGKYAWGQIPIPLPAYSREGSMTETATINNEELAILCDLMSGWGVKKWAENPGSVKKQALDRLVVHGYVELIHEASASRYRHTPKTEMLFAQLCVGISGG
jgi:hypothetical protein